MHGFNSLYGFGRGTALVLALSLAATALPRPVRADPEIENLARVEAVYVADPAAPWFEAWAETSFKAGDWLHRPDIRIKAGADLVAAVAADPGGVGLLTRGELTRLQAAGAPQTRTVPTGLAVCAATLVNEARLEASFGDFALGRDPIEVLATTDTLAIAEALIDAHRFQDRMTLKQVKPAFALAELASGKPVLAILPVLPGARVDVPDDAASLRPIAMTEAASQALQSRGLAPRDYLTSLLQQLPFVHGIRTACDDIVLITAPDRSIASDAFNAAPSPWSNPLAGSDLQARVSQAWSALRLWWQKPAETRG
jgi:hypothetical protein